MNILYASNDKYADFLGISMYSLLENNKDIEDISVYVFSNGISVTNKARLIEEATHFNRKIDFIDISDLEERIGFAVNASGYNITTLARLFIDDLLPEGIEKILYLDCDIIVDNNIEELWNTDITEYDMAAVVEVYMPADKKRKIGLTKKDSYYNAGMLLINRTLWRQQSLKTKFLDYYEESGGRLLYNDQDIINHCCKGRIKPISATYNFEPNVYYFPYYYIKIINRDYFIYGKKEYTKMIMNPRMIHFLGDERPWVVGNKNPYRDIFYKYQNDSGWSQIDWITGKEKYMRLYHILNMVTKIFPPIRTLITIIIGINKFKWFGKQ